MELRKRSRVRSEGAPTGEEVLDQGNRFSTGEQDPVDPAVPTNPKRYFQSIQETSVPVQALSDKGFVAYR